MSARSQVVQQLSLDFAPGESVVLVEHTVIRRPKGQGKRLAGVVAGDVALGVAAGLVLGGHVFVANSIVRTGLIVVTNQWVTVTERDRPRKAVKWSRGAPRQIVFRAPRRELVADLLPGAIAGLGIRRASDAALLLRLAFGLRHSAARRVVAAVEQGAPAVSRY